MIKNIFPAEKLIAHAELHLKNKNPHPGYDSMNSEGTIAWLKVNGERLCQDLNDLSYKPMPVIGFRTAKTRGGYRKLVRPTVLDSVIQQTVLEEVSAVCEKKFSDNSHAYRPGKGVSSAISQYVAYSKIYGFAAKLDFVSCFDNIDHGILESSLLDLIDKKTVSLIFKYVKNPIFEDGGISIPEKGIFQGMPISPLLCNVYMNNADRFMADNGIPFIRYADDIVLFAKTADEIKSFRDAVCIFIENECKLTCNSDKCQIDSPVRLTFLGHRFEVDKKGMIVETSGDESKVTYKSWKSGDIPDPHGRVDIISDGILRQRDYDLLFETETASTDIPPITTKIINIYSNVIFDDGFLKRALKHGIQVNIFDDENNKIGSFLPDRAMNSPSLLHKQILAYYDSNHRLILAKEFVLAYIHNACLNIRYHNKENPDEYYKHSLYVLESLKRKIKEKCDSYDDLLLLEAQAHKEYYSCFDSFIHEDGFVFETRSKRPPKNEINALISFGNTVLYNLIATEIQKTSLDIQIGFLHATNKRRESLNLDISEIFKPLVVDRVIFRLINMRILKKEHFCNKNDAVYLNAEGKKIFLKALYEKLGTVVSVGVDKKRMSYNTILTEEIDKIIRHFRQDEKYKGFRQVR